MHQLAQVLLGLQTRALLHLQSMEKSALIALHALNRGLRRVAGLSVVTEFGGHEVY
jgi:hypothetical protein